MSRQKPIIPEPFAFIAGGGGLRPERQARGGWGRAGARKRRRKAAKGMGDERGGFRVRQRGRSACSEKFAGDGSGAAPSEAPVGASPRARGGGHFRGADSSGDGPRSAGRRGPGHKWQRSDGTALAAAPGRPGSAASARSPSSQCQAIGGR